MAGKTSMRDAFYDTLFERAKQDKRIAVVAADMGAPALDKFRVELPGQYEDTGIAEQQAIGLAAGFAMDGKRPFVYAIAPFLTSRIHEFIKLEMGLMGLPITLVGVSGGYGYPDSGPTHHQVEDIASLRSIPQLEIWSPSGNYCTSELVDRVLESGKPAYIRLDREHLPEFYDEKEQFRAGFKELHKGKKLAILATGNMVAEAMEVRAATGRESDVGIIDVYRLKPLSESLAGVISQYDRTLTLEEHFRQGGFGSAILELANANDLRGPVIMGADNRYNYEYGSRAHIRNRMGMGRDKLVDTVNNLI